MRGIKVFTVAALVVAGGIVTIASVAPCERDAMAASRLARVDPADAGAASDAAESDASDADARRDAVADASVAEPLRPTAVSIENVAFENGDIPRAPVALERMKKELARCASGDEKLPRDGAVVEVRFLVRGPGRAEGVDVVSARGMSANVARCVISVLAGRLIGTPSNDPVGVGVSLRFGKG